MLPPLASLAPQAGCGFWQRPQRAQSCGRSSWPAQQPGNRLSVPRKGQSTDSIYSDRWSVTGYSPAVLEPGTRCKAVTQEWASLRVIPPLEATANQPCCCDTARCRENPRWERRGNDETVLGRRWYQTSVGMCSLRLLYLSLWFSHIPSHSPGESLTAVGIDQDLSLFLPRYHRCMILSYLIPALLMAP